jgi:hypothetical protein
LTNLHELQYLLDDTADDLAQLLPDTDEWKGAIAYLLKALEVKAMDRDRFHPMNYDRFLDSLATDIRLRLRDKQW